MTHPKVSRFLFSVLLLLLASAGTARAAGEVGNLSRLDEEPSCEDQMPDIAPLADGGYVAVWMAGIQDRPSSLPQILGRLLDREGRPRGPVFRLDAGSTFPWNPEVAADAVGNFMVTWTQQNTGAMRGRVFSPSGTPLTGDLEIAPPALYTTGARIVAERDGGFTVLWHAATSLQRRRYTAGGEPLGPAETLFTGPTFLDLAAAPHGDDGIVAVWTMPGPQIRGGIFHPGEEPVLFHVHTYSAAAASRFYFADPLLAIASRPDDLFLVTWWDVANNWPAVSEQAFAPTGQPLGQVFRIDDPEAINVNEPLGLDVVVDAAGNYVAGWQGGHPSQRGRITIWTRTLGPDGTPRGPAVESAVSSHEDPSYLALAGGRQGGPCCSGRTAAGPSTGSRPPFRPASARASTPAPSSRPAPGGNASVSRTGGSRSGSPGRCRTARPARGRRSASPASPATSGSSATTMSSWRSRSSTAGSRTDTSGSSTVRSPTSAIRSPSTTR